MSSVKQRFENDEHLQEGLRAFTEERLKADGVPESKAFNSSNLVCTIAGLMTAKPAAFLGIAVQKKGSSVVIRMVTDGPAYNPLEDLHLRQLIENDPPLPDDDFDTPEVKEQLLKALRNSLSYYRRNRRNEVEYIVHRGSAQTLKQVTAAFLLAIVIGLLLRYFGSETVQNVASTYILTPIRTMFLNALKMLVVPVVFFAISSSVANVSDIREYGRIGGKVFGFYTTTSFIAILVGFLLYQLLQPGNGVVIDLTSLSYSADTSEGVSILDTIVGIIPSSFVGSFTGTNMLQIIFLAILTGVAANLLDNGDDRQKICSALGLLNRLFLKLASLVMYAIPLATFCAMCLLMLTIDSSMVAALFKLVLGMVLGVVLMFTAYSLLFLGFVRKNPLRFLKKCIPNFISFITFCSTSAVMPQSLETCSKKLGISTRVSSFSMPLGSTINMDGACVYLTLSTLFLAAVYQVQISPQMMLQLAVTIVILSMGAPPIAGAGFICLSVLIQQIGIPIESLGILMGIDQVMSMCRTVINGTGDFTGTAVVAKSEGLMDFRTFDQD